MKRIIKVDLKKYKRDLGDGRTNTLTQWPHGWKAEMASVVAYEDNPDIGKHIKHCIAVVEEVDLLYFASLDGIEEIDKKEANKLGRQWRPQRVKVVDPDAVLIALSRAIEYQCEGLLLKDVLSDDERKILEADSDTPGINKSIRFNIEDALGD